MILKFDLLLLFGELICGFVVYALSSLLAFDPWHMITSFIPYIFLSPTYINVLNVFVISRRCSLMWVD